MAKILETGIVWNPSHAGRPPHPPPCPPRTRQPSSRPVPWGRAERRAGDAVTAMVVGVGGARRPRGCRQYRSPGFWPSAAGGPRADRAPATNNTASVQVDDDPLPGADTCPQDFTVDRHAGCRDQIGVPCTRSLEANVHVITAWKHRKLLHSLTRLVAGRRAPTGATCVPRPPPVMVRPPFF